MKKLSDYKEEYNLIIKILETGELLTAKQIGEITKLKKGYLQNFINVLGQNCLLYEEEGPPIRYGLLKL